jgi:hypothetical protein
MRKYGVIIVLNLTLGGFLLGQAVMSPPVLKSTPEEISFATRFSEFTAGENYRIGVGAAGEEIRDAKIELVKGDTVLSSETATFEQGYTRSWFEVDNISVQGFLLSDDQFPADGEQLILRVTVPRPEAERLKRLFVVLARQYGPTRWYIEDGSELNDSVW